MYFTYSNKNTEYFFLGVFCYAVSSWQYWRLGWWTGKNLEGSNHGLRYYPGIYLEGLSKITSTLSQVSQCPGQGVKLPPSECESTALLLCQLMQRNSESSNHHTFCTLTYFKFGAGKSSVFCESTDIKVKK